MAVREKKRQKKKALQCFRLSSTLTERLKWNTFFKIGLFSSQFLRVKCQNWGCFSIDLWWEPLYHTTAEAHGTQRSCCRKPGCYLGVRLLFCNNSQELPRILPEFCNLFWCQCPPSDPITAALPPEVPSKKLLTHGHLGDPLNSYSCHTI